MKIGIYVDINNLYYTIKTAYGKRLDYASLYSYCQTFGTVTVAKAYGSKSAFSVNFNCMLKKVGFETIYKEPKPEGDTFTCDWGVGIAMDVVSDKDKFDVLVLCSGDGDLLPLVEQLGRKTIIIACNPNKELRKHAYTVLDIPEALLCN